MCKSLQVRVYYKSNIKSNKVAKNFLFGFKTDMQITRTDNTNFTQLIKTEELIKTMTGDSRLGVNYESYKNLVCTLRPNHRFVGNLGYKGQAELLIKKVCAKYTPLAKEVKNIKDFLDANPVLGKNEKMQLTKSSVEKFGEIIDIEV